MTPMITNLKRCAGYERVAGCRNPVYVLTGLIALLTVLWAPGADAQAKFGNETAITSDRLKSHLEFIASDEMEGRDTPSRGLDTATLYIATQLKLWGAQPAGDDGTFFQKVPLSQRTVDATKSTIEIGGKSYTFGDGIKSATKGVTATGKLVYVGHGYMFKKKGIDPYTGVDVKGKIMVVASGLPQGAGFEDMQGTAGEDYAWPVLGAQKHGALGILTVADARTLAAWDAQNGAKMGGISPDDVQGFDSTVGNVVIGPDLAKAVFEGEAVSADDVKKGREAPEKGFSLSDSKNVAVTVVEHKEMWYPRNVIALVPGSDPKLKNEYVAFGAHIDHVGMRTSGPGDRIYNGADDDGSGTVSILEIAHALLAGKHPKRSCIFVWHIGEEKGMWGSAFFTNHPTVDIKKVITQLNIDMIGRSRPPGDTKPANAVLTGPDEIYLVGSTKMSTDLQKVSEAVNARFLKIKFNYKYDDPKDREGIFFRSDHYNYARKGIPIIFYFDGVHEDYHQPSDEVSKIDFVKMTRVARTIFATGWTLANANSRPVVDKPLKQ